MLNFSSLSVADFLNHFWQKKPLLIPHALPEFNAYLSPDCLAGLAMEEDIESRIVLHTPKKAPHWHLKRGPFTRDTFRRLPKTHWTLLVQGVDRFIPEISALLQHFNFIPSWRVDDVMISYAVKEGSVGPHYDNYDVFLYQAKGQRQWMLTTKDCVENNADPTAPLRIMKSFPAEETWVLNEGDMLYLPPHVGHHGVALTDDCMTYSFGYRSYPVRELWENFADFMSSHKSASSLYQDPCWLSLQGAGEIPKEAWQNAQAMLQMLVEDEELIQEWFASFVTRLDEHAESILPFSRDKTVSLAKFEACIKKAGGLWRHPVCRFAYTIKNTELSFYVNGERWPSDAVHPSLLKGLADDHYLPWSRLEPFLQDETNRRFLFQLWCKRYVDDDKQG